MQSRCGLPRGHASGNASASWQTEHETTTMFNTASPALRRLFALMLSVSALGTASLAFGTVCVGDCTARSAAASVVSQPWVIRLLYARPVLRPPETCWQPQAVALAMPCARTALHSGSLHVVDAPFAMLMFNVSVFIFCPLVWWKPILKRCFVPFKNDRWRKRCSPSARRQSSKTT